MKIVVDTAVVIPVNILPLTDDTDFKTRETSVAYNAAGMDLVWNFVTTAGVMTQTAVTPTTSGTYDWTHVGDGMYKIEIPASGGGSINNDTEGYGWFTGLATGVLPWGSPVYEFVPANVANSLVNGSDLLDTEPSATGIRAAVGMTSANLDTQLSTIAGYLDTEIASIISSLSTLSGYVDTEVAAIKAKTDNLPSDPADASDIATAFGTVNSTLSTIAGYIDTEIASIVSSLSTLTGYVDTEVAAIKAKTDNLPADPAASGDIPSAATIAAEVDSTLSTAHGEGSWEGGGGGGGGDATEAKQDQIIAALAVVDGNVDSVLADTNELQTDWANGGRLDVILDARASQTSVDDVPTNAELASALSPLATAANLATVDTVVDGLTTELAKVHKAGETRRYTQEASNDVNKTADVSIGNAL